MYIDEYNEYLNSYDDLIKMGDLREYMVQEFVIRSFLQKIMPELDVIPTHTKINDYCTIHKYEKYCGISKEGKTVTPDLCISKKWRWDNNGDVDYRALVEVKSPIGYKISDYEIIQNDTTKKDRKQAAQLTNIQDIGNSKVREELIAHSQINENKTVNKVIFTDGVAWLFIEGEEVKKRYDIGKRMLRKYVNERGKVDYEFKGIKWLDKENEQVDDLVIRQMFGKPITKEGAPREFNKLIGQIKHFCEY